MASSANSCASSNSSVVLSLTSASPSIIVSPKYQPPSLQKVVRANTGAPAQTAQLVFWGALRGVGEASKSVREGIELLDIFVGRYLLLTTVAYVGIKFVHFKLWDPFPM